MVLEIGDEGRLSRYLARELEPICDAEPTVLADYVIALLKKEQPEDELRVTALGTGYPARRAQGCAGFMVEVGNGDVFIFDAGAGTNSSFNTMRVPYWKATKIFISHYHLDHIGDRGRHETAYRCALPHPPTDVARGHLQTGHLHDPMGPAGGRTAALPALPVDDHHRRQHAHDIGSVPRGKSGSGVRSDHQEAFVIGAFERQRFESVGRVRRSASIDLHP